jgi:hypothetical protein
MSIVLQSSGGGQITIQEPATASNFTQTLPAADGTVVVSGTTPTLNGITFPATQVPSADANTLDDYEEGTWTPNVNQGTATITSVSGQYTKIGNRVICSFGFTCNSTGSVTFIGGLPFTVTNTHCGAAREIAAGGIMWAAQPVQSQIYFAFRQYDNGSTMTNTHVYVGTVVYQV